MCPFVVGCYYQLAFTERSIACFVGLVIFGCHELLPGVLLIFFLKVCSSALWIDYQAVFCSIHSSQQGVPEFYVSTLLLFAAQTLEHPSFSFLFFFSFSFEECLVVLATIAAQAGNMVTTREQWSPTFSMLLSFAYNRTRSEWCCWFRLHLRKWKYTYASQRGCNAASWWQWVAVEWCFLLLCHVKWTACYAPKEDFVYKLLCSTRSVENARIVMLKLWTTLFELC